MNSTFNKKIDLIILAGGKGSRIKNLTNKTPKPLIKFNNKPILQYILNYFVKFNFNKIFILAGYKGDQIYKKYNESLTDSFLYLSSFTNTGYIFFQEQTLFLFGLDM